MKTYSREEKEVAKKKLPRPVHDYLGSKKLSDTYLGLQKKLKLDLRQLLAVSEVVNVTLMGLETESALETNIHFVLHELSNEKTRELVADINDRVFKEARRRVQEGITEPDPPPPIPRPETDVELEALEEKQKREGWVPEFEKRKQEEIEYEKTQLAIERTKKEEAPATGTISDLLSPNTVRPGGSQITSTTQTGDISTTANVPSYTPSPSIAPSIAEEKLRTPTQVNEPQTINSPQNRGQLRQPTSTALSSQITKQKEAPQQPEPVSQPATTVPTLSVPQPQKPAPSPVAATPVSTAPQVPPPPQNSNTSPPTSEQKPTPPPTYKGSDPYRESID